VRSLFDAGAEMDTTTRNFGNALHLASYMGSEVIIRQLLERMEDSGLLIFQELFSMYPNS
jgi:ankyrin repeat protein